MSRCTLRERYSCCCDRCLSALPPLDEIEQAEPERDELEQKVIPQQQQQDDDNNDDDDQSDRRSDFASTTASSQLGAVAESDDDDGIRSDASACVAAVAEAAAAAAAIPVSSDRDIDPIPSASSESVYVFYPLPFDTPPLPTACEQNFIVTERVVIERRWRVKRIVERVPRKMRHAHVNDKFFAYLWQTPDDVPLCPYLAIQRGYRCPGLARELRTFVWAPACEAVEAPCAVLTWGGERATRHVDVVRPDGKKQHREWQGRVQNIRRAVARLRRRRRRARVPHRPQHKCFRNPRCRRRRFAIGARAYGCRRVPLYPFTTAAQAGGFDVRGVEKVERKDKFKRRDAAKRVCAGVGAGGEHVIRAGERSANARSKVRSFADALALEIDDAFASALDCYDFDSFSNDLSEEWMAEFIVPRK